MRNLISKERSGIKAGDLLVMYLDNPKGLLLSIGRNNPDYSREVFEGTLDDKEVVKGYSSDVSGALQLAMFIAKITGLQAREAAKQKEFISFVMEEGDSLLK